MAVDVKKTTAVTRSKVDRPKAKDPSRVFKGFVAFYLYGYPILTKPKDSLAYFSTGGELQGTKSSCRYANKKKKLENQKQKCISVTKGPVASADSIVECIGLCTANTCTVNSIDNLQISHNKKIQRALCLCETKIANLVAIRAQLFALYNSFENKGTPKAKVIANNCYLKKVLAIDDEFTDGEKEKKKLKIANQ